MMIPIAPNVPAHQARSPAAQLIAPPAQPEPNGSYPDRIVLRARGRVHPVRVDDVVMLDSEAPYLVVHTALGTIRVRASLSDVEKMLDPDHFARVHRGTVVRIDQVAEVIQRDRGDCDLRLRNGMMTRLARRRAPSFARAIG